MIHLEGEKILIGHKTHQVFAENLYNHFILTRSFIMQSLFSCIWPTATRIDSPSSINITWTECRLTDFCKRILIPQNQYKRNAYYNILLTSYLQDFCMNGKPKPVKQIKTKQKKIIRPKIQNNYSYETPNSYLSLKLLGYIGKQNRLLKVN